MALPADTKVRVKSSVECGDMYKRPCLLSFYDTKREGRTWVDVDSGELVIAYPWGLSTPTNGVCYFFRAEEIELVPFKQTF